MKNNAFKKILCSSLAGMVLLLASCTPIDVSEESSEGNISGVIYHSQDVQSNASEEKSENASEMISESASEAPSEEISEEVSIDVELKIPTTITADSVDSFFNDSIFVGNSIMLKYQRFVNKYRASSVPDFLGTSEFFCGGSFGVYHNNHTPATSNGAVNPTYKEKKYSVQDMVGVANPKRVLINLAGLNDMGIYSSASICAEETAKEMIKIIKDIKEKYPNVEVVVLSTTYMIKSWNSMPKLNNENLSIMNNLVLDYCNSNGVDYVDISSLLNENGCLADKYCSDPDSGGCHLNDSGCLVWTGLLRNYAAKKLAGVYKNPESMPALAKG
jgi:hypothetical protein